MFRSHRSVRNYLTIRSCYDHIHISGTSFSDPVLNIKIQNQFVYMFCSAVYFFLSVLLFFDRSDLEIRSCESRSNVNGWANSSFSALVVWRFVSSVDFSAVNWVFAEVSCWFSPVSLAFSASRVSIFEFSSVINSFAFASSAWVAFFFFRMLLISDFNFPISLFRSDNWPWRLLLVPVME